MVGFQGSFETETIGSERNVEYSLSVLDQVREQRASISIQEKYVDVSKNKFDRILFECRSLFALKCSAPWISS